MYVVVRFVLQPGLAEDNGRGFVCLWNVFRMAAIILSPWFAEVTSRTIDGQVVHVVLAVLCALKIGISTAGAALSTSSGSSPMRGFVLMVRAIIFAVHVVSQVAKKRRAAAVRGGRGDVEDVPRELQVVEVVLLTEGQVLRLGHAVFQPEVDRVRGADAVHVPASGGRVVALLPRERVDQDRLVVVHPLRFEHRNRKVSNLLRANQVRRQALEVIEVQGQP